MKTLVVILAIVIAANSVAAEPTSIVQDPAIVLRNQGFLQAREDTAGVVRIGGRYMLQRIIVTDSIIDTIAYRDTPFSQKAVQSQIARILSRIESAGYYLVSAAIDDITASDTDLTIHLTVTRGPLVIAHGYVFSGLEKTGHQLVDRYLPSIEKRPITPELVAEIERRAERIPFLTFVPRADIRPREGYTSADVGLAFIERRQFHLEGIVGYVPSTSTGVLWSLDARFQNILGGGRDASVKSERRESGRNLLDIGYAQPVFFAGVGHLEGRIATRDYRDQFYEFALSTRYEIQLSPLFSADVSLGWRNVEPSTDLAAYRVFSAGFGVSAANRANRYRELPYYSLNWTVGYSYRRYRDDSLSIAPQQTAINETRTTLELSATLPFYRGLAGHFNTTYWGYETAESLPPISEMYFLGGPGTIRGFRNEQFIAQRAAMVVVEPRVRFREGYLFAFLDGAYLNVPGLLANQQIATDESFEWGYGLGIDIRSLRRAMNISLGWSRDLAFDEPRLSIQFISDI